jgi:hypothetical protein
MLDLAPWAAAPLRNAPMWRCNPCRTPVISLEGWHSSSYEYAAQEEKRRPSLIVQENEKDDL